MKKLNEAKESREKKMEEYNKNILEYNNVFNKIINKNNLENNNSEHSILLQELIIENKLLKEKVTYLENKIKELINEKIKSLKNM